MTNDLSDVNVLLALHLPSHENHRQACDWFDAAEGFALTPITQAGLVRLLLNPVVMNGAPASPASALAALDALQSAPGATFWPDDTPQLLGRFAYALTGHRQVTDLHLLALAVSKGGRLVTADAKIPAALRRADTKHVHLI